MRSNIGIVGFYAGPDVHIVDPFALADPLLARLPIAPKAGWGIGHFPRALPKGYLEAVLDGPAKLDDPRLRSLYEDVWQVTRGPIFSGARWSAIWRLATRRP